MVLITTMNKNLEDFNEKYPENMHVTLGDDFLNAVKNMSRELKFLEITFTTSVFKSHLQTVLDRVSKIMTHFQNRDMIKPLNNIHFCVYLKLSNAFTHLENILLANFVDNNEALQEDFINHFSKQQYICDNYKSKLEKFKANCTDVEVKIISENFTSFLIEYLKLLSQITGTWIKQKRNIKLLVDVADLRILLEHFHSVSNLIPKTNKISLMQKITELCIKEEYNLYNCSLLQSLNKDFRLETCAMSYFILQYICKQLELKKLNQTSQLLSKFNAENIIILIDSVTSDVEFEELYNISFEHIPFKTYKKIRVVPINEIKECLKNLHILLNSLSDRQLQNCPFPLILLSMLYELVMATDLDNVTIISLIDLVIGYLEFCKLPPNFNVISYALKMYQRFKYNDVLEFKFIEFCKILSKNLDLPKRKQYIRENLKNFGEEDLVEKSIVISYFLHEVEELCKCEDADMNNLIYSFNDLVLFSTQGMSKIHYQLLFPYSVSLHFSLINKNEECLFNNLALVKDFTTMVFDDYISIQPADKIYFLKLVTCHYEDIGQCLPDKFFIKCWRCVLNPKNMDISILKLLLQMCSHETLIKYIDDLTVVTMKLIKGNESKIHQKYYYDVDLLWSVLLNMQFVNQKKKIRKDHVNHFTFIINRTFLFNSKIIKSEHGLILLLKLICQFLKVPWINTSSLVNCALRVMTYIEKRSNISEVELLIEAAELLIVLYKYPHSTTKSVLGLYVNSFNNLLRKYWIFSDNFLKRELNLKKKRQLYIPLHKLEKCASLFKEHKSDFNIICRYFIEDLIELISLKHSFPAELMSFYYNIIFNLMDVCSDEEISLLMLNIQGPTLMILKDAYEEYRSKVMFTGRL